MGIEEDRLELARQLASVTATSTGAINAAIMTEYARPPQDRRNMVSVLASVAWLIALLEDLSEEQRTTWLQEVDVDVASRLDHLLTGKIEETAAELAETLAGPYDVAWDGNWPNARPRLRGKMPKSARPGDILTGGDGGGTRIDIRVVQETGGVLTGEVVSMETWRDPPREAVWIETYRRLESEYPEAVPRPDSSR